MSTTASDLCPCCHQGDFALEPRPYGVEVICRRCRHEVRQVRLDDDRDRLHTRTAAPPKPGRCLGCGKAAWTAYCPACCPAPGPDREQDLSCRYRRDDGANGRGPAVVWGEDLEGRETI